MKNGFNTKTLLIGIYLSICFFNANSLNAQIGWTLEQSGTTQDLYSVRFLDSNTGFVAGNNGTLLKTTNGGIFWIQQQTGTNNSFYSMCFPTPNTGYIVGTGGVLVKTTNAGLNWNLYPAGTSYPQYAMYFIDASIGYVVATLSLANNSILRTTNGGMNWSTYNLNTSFLKSVFFINTNTGFVAGNTFSTGYVYKTTNGGDNWTQLLNTPLGLYFSLFFNNLSTGYSAGQIIAKTTNAGDNWISMFSPTNIINSIYFSDINTGYASGTNGAIYKTITGGSNWVLQQNLVTSNSLLDIKFINASTGYAVGTFGTIIKTTTGGEPVGIHPKGNEIPETFSLSQNYPNPFNPSTKIEYQIPKTSFVRLTVFDILGREIAKLVNEELAPGIYEIEWDGSNYASGIYFYRLTVEDSQTISGFVYSETKKLVLLK